MIVQSFFVPGLAHTSYILGGTTHCAVVDPRRDTEIYLQAAKELNLSITHVLETHLHADFVSGHRDLAKKTGAQIVMPRAAHADFPHLPVRDGDKIQLDDVVIEVLETPGHTPEHVTYVAHDLARGPGPVSAFCGDTLFVGDVGRPDLFPGKATTLAGELFDSLHLKLMKLPDFCEVYPAHGAGSLCGRAMGAKRESTVGYEKITNGSLLVKEKSSFIESLTTNMPAAPDHFSRCSRVNGKGPVPLDELPPPLALSPEAFNKRLSDPGVQVLDVRDTNAFGGNHIKGATHIDLGGNFATFAGWVLPPDREILLVADRSGDVDMALTWLRRVGLDQVAGTLEGSMFAWTKAGLPTGHVSQISPFELPELASAAGNPVTIVDVRSPSEFEAFHIEGAVNIPAPDLRFRFDELDSRARVVTVCGTGHRSSLAASLLMQRGFSSVTNLSGGMMGYSAAGLAPTCPLCVSPHGPRFTGESRDGKP